MSGNFWHQLAQPIIGQSPMDGITDHPYRHITKKYGQPAVMMTEFTSVEGVCHGAVNLLKDFLFDETQRPIIGQIYGTTPEYFRQTAILLCQLGFDGIDINMGCPAKNVAHSGAGAALIKTPDLAQDIIRSVYQGIMEWQNGATAQDCVDLTPDIANEVTKRASQLPPQYQDRTRTVPVSVKTRVGYYQPTIADWIPYLLDMKPTTITIHGRTLKQQYGGEANWEEIGQAVQTAAGSGVLILGNGDVKTRAQALERVRDYGVNGVLIGRAAMGNPYVFVDEIPADKPHRFQIALEHAQLYETTFGQEERYNFLPMRKHLGWYVKDIPNASQVRIELFSTNTAEDVKNVLNKHGLLDGQVTS